jgi:L-histidine Nalpha-methyltransferase
MIGTITDKVARAVEDGLFRRDKFLPSWLFYDDIGDRIFQEIMHMPEYYLTRCEYEILDQYKSDLGREFSSGGKFNLIELGPGDGLKTEILLRYFQRNGISFTYSPIDISGNVLVQLETRLKNVLPDLMFNPQQGDYTDILAHLKGSTDERNVILFMGSNIGNLNVPGAIHFLQRISPNMNTDDLLVLGVDLQKDPEVIRKAYDDPQGITKRFNLNLLLRLNSELGAEFDVDKFEHAPTYDPMTGVAASFLVSKESHEVYIAALDRRVSFRKGERIHTEVSIKYNRKMIDDLVSGAGLRVKREFYDRRNFFCDLVLGR